MIIALGADHRGFAYKEAIKLHLTDKGIEVNDFGTFSEEGADYSDHALAVAKEISSGKVDSGILVCGSGNGMAIAANKVKGIRASLALNLEMAKLARAHNDANILVLSALYTPRDKLENIVDAFLSTQFEGGRHQRRLDKIKKYEDEDRC